MVKNALLSKFVVSLVASAVLTCLRCTRDVKSLVCRCKKPQHNVSNSRGTFSYSFILYEIRNIIV
jgi:hypothetical protein